MFQKASEYQPIILVTLQEVVQLEKTDDIGLQHEQKKWISLSKKESDSKEKTK